MKWFKIREGFEELSDLQKKSLFFFNEIFLIRLLPVVFLIAVVRNSTKNTLPYVPVSAKFFPVFCLEYLGDRMRVKPL